MPESPEGLVHHHAPMTTARTSTPARITRKTKPTTRFRIMKSKIATMIPPTLESVNGMFIRIVGSWQKAVGSKSSSVCCQLPTANCLLLLIARSDNRFDVAANVEVAFDLDA